MPFDPPVIRRQLEVFEIGHYREASFAEAFHEHTLNVGGWAMLACGIRCLLVGSIDVGRELVLKASHFLRFAIYEERPFLSDASRYEDLALCLWLIEWRHDVRNLTSAAAARERGYVVRRAATSSDLDWALPVYLDAREYELLIQRFEQSGLEEPADLRGIDSEAAMCYALARERLGRDSASAEIKNALDEFLKRKMRRWLDAGHYSRAARWAKIAFWRHKLDAIAAFLRLYDYLPNLERPAYTERVLPVIAPRHLKPVARTGWHESPILP